jgi:hypothetical protein
MVEATVPSTDLVRLLIGFSKAAMSSVEHGTQACIDGGVLPYLSLQKCNGGASQTFYLVPLDSITGCTPNLQYFKILLASTGKCLQSMSAAHGTNFAFGMCSVAATDPSQAFVIDGELCTYLVCPFLLPFFRFTCNSGHVPLRQLPTLNSCRVCIASKRYCFVASSHMRKLGLCMRRLLYKYLLSQLSHCNLQKTVFGTDLYPLYPLQSQSLWTGNYGSSGKRAWDDGAHSGNETSAPCVPVQPFHVGNYYQRHKRLYGSLMGCTDEM